MMNCIILYLEVSLFQYQPIPFIKKFLVLDLCKHDVSLANFQLKKKLYTCWLFQYSVSIFCLFVVIYFVCCNLSVFDIYFPFFIVFYWICLSDSILDLVSLSIDVLPVRWLVLYWVVWPMSSVMQIYMYMYVYLLDSFFGNRFETHALW